MTGLVVALTYVLQAVGVCGLGWGAVIALRAREW
ncbi:hypothetical protein FHU40_003727 [Nocardioides soli]|uniref:Uncharacterized protein n=1 Tax=Nocardioides soli TaxID=1036020 RepID=A0A7W4Z1Z5_9ACTN|nr:hypothetical protein [Nocardioides soli]